MQVSFDKIIDSIQLPEWTIMFRKYSYFMSTIEYISYNVSFVQNAHMVLLEPTALHAVFVVIMNLVVMWMVSATTGYVRQDIGVWTAAKVKCFFLYNIMILKCCSLFLNLKPLHIQYDLDIIAFSNIAHVFICTYAMKLFNSKTYN